MVKFILLIAIARISIPLLWNFLFPFLIAQGWNLNTPNNFSNLNFKSNVAKSEQNLTKFQKIYMYTMYTYIKL